MKTITSALASYLASVTSTYRADLLTLTLPNQQTITAAMGVSDDVTWNGTVYPASALGVWTRGPQTAVADVSLESQNLSLSLVALDSVLVPGTTTPIMSVISLGFFDGCPLTIDTVYMALGAFPTILGSLRLFAGSIVAANRVGRSKAEFECQDWCYLLNLKVPIKVIQPSCPHSLFDHGCALDVTAFLIRNAVGAGSTPAVIVPGSAWPTMDVRGNNPQVAPYFQQGKLLFTSGQNQNLYGHIAAQQSGPTGAISLNQAMPFPVAVGDTFEIVAGCDKTLGTCTAKFANAVHFGGQPFVPVPERSI